MEERAWETWGENDLEDEFQWDDLGEPDYENIPADVAEEEFVRMLVGLKLTNVLSARQVCTLAFWHLERVRRVRLRRWRCGPMLRLASFRKSLTVSSGQSRLMCLHTVWAQFRGRGQVQGGHSK